MQFVNQADQAERLHAALRARRLTLATAESLTGGALADLVSSVPGASATYLGGVVSYATAVKQQLLGVSLVTIETHGVVSAQCAAEMARGVRVLLGSDIGVSTTGVAGPDRQEGQPVGTAWLGVALPSGTEAVPVRLPGDRLRIRQLAAISLLDLLRRKLLSMVA